MSTRPSEYLFAALCAFTAIGSLIHFFNTPPNTHDDSSRWGTLVIGLLFGVPGLLGIVEMLIGPERMSRSQTWLTRLVLGGWFITFGGLMIFGGLFQADKLVGGLPFLSNQVNERLGGGTFVIIGALIALLGLLAGWEGIKHVLNMKDR